MSTELSDAILREYTSRTAIAKYSKRTAGAGIEYLLEHDYKRVYAEALAMMATEPNELGLRLLEFGCGAGMNLISLVSWLNGQGVHVERAVGTDISPVLVETARREAKSYLPESNRTRVEFYIARNERLIEDLGKATASEISTLRNSFHFAVGVNTIRYCHRAGTQRDCSSGIWQLLVPGGTCVVIDMNDRFPFFRSRLKRRLFGLDLEDDKHRLPSLNDHAAALAEAGFEILRTKNLCWVPHSSGPILLHFIRGIAPMLDFVAGSRAMRSLVVARKPA